MKKEIIRLREVMKDHGIDGYLVPTTDFHGSEYVNDYFKCRRYLSQFTGSNGTLLITQDEALLWTDSRYFVQAPKQLEGTGISMMKCQTPGVPEIPEYLPMIANEDFVLGFDGRVVSYNDGVKYASACKVRHDVDLVDLIWEDRPAISPSKIYCLSETLTGESYTSKLQRLQNCLRDESLDYHLIPCLEEIAWLFNLRGEDVKYTPVFFAFALITPDSAKLYVLDPDFEGLTGVTTLPYLQIFDDLKSLKQGKCLVSKRIVSYTLMEAIPDDVEIIDGPSPVELMKAQKNKVEIEGTKKAQMLDGAAMTNFIYWLKHNVASGEVSATELSACDKLESYRKANPALLDLSFETMAGYGVNGASIHYDTMMGDPCPLLQSGFLLVDSGGQYMDEEASICGTTDVTRTISLGPLTKEMKEHYTIVLRAYLALAHAEFDASQAGETLDKIAKDVAAEAGPVYSYDTGHGVGHLLSVHEGPRMIGRTDKPMLPGMIVSNEPGIYIDGSHGIRIENELLVTDLGDGHRGFEQISWIPMDRAAILPEKMTAEEIDWLNDYHREVYEKIAPLLDEPVRQWLKEETATITA